MKKILLLLTSLVFMTRASMAQQNYCDFEGMQVVTFGDATGSLDTMFANPLMMGADTSAHCAKYIRSTTSYDFIKMYPYSDLVDVSIYADSNVLAPRISMKVLSTAPVGTAILLQLGIKSVDNYPAGIHSEYIAVTKTQNVWEVDTFKFWQKPAGSLATSNDIDKVVLMFHPGSNGNDSMYFDDLMGPSLLPPIGVPSAPPAASFLLHQNYPNPAQDKTTVPFQLGTAGHVSLEIFDLLGNRIRNVADKEMKAGHHSLPVETTNLQEGIYFYILKMEDHSLARKMVVAR